MTADQIESAAACLVGAVAVAVLGYRLGSGEPATAALGAALAVLLVAIPVALRLATGLPLLVGTGRPAQLGVLLYEPQALHIDTVVLAGTGTLTTAELEVHAIHAVGGVAPADVLRLAGAVAHESDRPTDRAVAAAASRLPGVADFDAVGDLGVRGIVAEVVADDGGPRVLAHAVLVGSVELLTAHDIALPPDLAAAAASSAAAGRVAVAVAWDGVARAVLDIGCAVAPTVAAAVRRLHALGLRPVLLAAEPAPAAHAIAARAGLAPDSVVAGIPPEDEAALVRGLRDGGARVAVIADCSHGAALAAADLAVRIGCDHWFGAGSPGPARSPGDLPSAVEAIRLARHTVAVTRTNVVWALAYVVAVVPAAAAGLLGPLLSAAMTAAGAAVIAANSLRLRRYGTTRG